jgi:hypothetical protein
MGNFDNLQKDIGEEMVVQSVQGKIKQQRNGLMILKLYIITMITLKLYITILKLI